MIRKLIFMLLKNRRARHLGLKLLKNPRVQRAIFDQVSRRLRGR